MGSFRQYHSNREDDLHGLWERLAEAVRRGQLEKAAAELPIHLRAADENRLRKFGYSEREIERIRTEARP